MYDYDSRDQEGMEYDPPPCGACLGEPMCHYEDCPNAPDDFMECWECGGFYPNPPVMRKVVGQGPVINERVDPTQTYRLECGHFAF